MLLWSQAIVELRDNFFRGALADCNAYHKDLLCRVRIVANNMKWHMIPLLESNRAALTEFVYEYWDAARSCSEINWRQAPASPHVYLGLIWIALVLGVLVHWRLMFKVRRGPWPLNKYFKFFINPITYSADDLFHRWAVQPVQLHRFQPSSTPSNCLANSETVHSFNTTCVHISYNVNVS